MTVAIGVAELRNRGYGTGHGATSARVGLHARHAHLAVNAAITWCQLMHDTLADANAPWRAEAPTSRAKTPRRDAAGRPASVSAVGTENRHGAIAASRRLRLRSATRAARSRYGLSIRRLLGLGGTAFAEEEHPSPVRTAPAASGQLVQRGQCGGDEGGTPVAEPGWQQRRLNDL